MAQLSLIVWPAGIDKSKATEGYIVFRLTHKKLRRLINTGVKVNLSDYKTGKININSRKTYSAIHAKKDLYTERLVELLGKKESMDIDQIKKYVLGAQLKEKERPNIFVELEALAKQIEEEDSSNTYPALFRNTRNSLRKWWGTEVLYFDELSYPELKDYERWLKQQVHTVNIKKRGKIIGSRLENYKPNTISVQFRCIRRIFNWVIDDGRLDPEIYPFRKFKKEKTRNPLRVFSSKHRDLTLEQLRAIRDLDLSKDYRRVQQARDMFMLSFYLVGMNLVDIWRFDWGAAASGHAQYVRRKTHKGLQFTICEEAMQYLNKYCDEDYTFLIKKRINHYSSFLSEVNKGLKYLGDYIGVPDLTFYYARHTWSTIAETKCGISREDVSLALSHGAKTVTGLYVNLDRNMRERIDNCHRKVLQYVAGTDYNIPGSTKYFDNAVNYLFVPIKKDSQ